MRARIGETEERERRGDHLEDVVEVAVGEVEERDVEKLLAVAFEQRVVDERSRIRPRSTGASPEGPVRVELVVDRVGELEHHVEAARDLLEQAVGERRDHRGVLLQDPAPPLRVSQRRDPLGEGELRDLVEAGGEEERVRGRLEPEQDSDRPRRDLRLHVEPVGPHPRDAVEDLPPPLGRVVRLLHGERDRPARRTGERFDQCELRLGELVVGRLVEVRDQLGDAEPGAAEHFGEGQQLARAGGQGPDVLARLGAVHVGAGGREADRARFERFTEEERKLCELVVGRRLGVVRAAVAHHVGAQSCVRHVRGEVEGVRLGVERVEILGERLPVPRQPLGQRGPGDVLDALEQTDEPVVAIDVRRGEPDPAVAHGDRGHAVDRRRRDDRVPRDLAVEVGVDVDEARGHEETLGVDLPGA